MQESRAKLKKKLRIHDYKKRTSELNSASMITGKRELNLDKKLSFTKYIDHNSPATPKLGNTLVEP